jgi:hypothetical protein
MDATPTYATGSGTDNRPNPAAITPVTAGAWIVCCGGGAAAAGTTLYTAAYLTNLLTYNGADTNDGTVGSGYYTGWTSGAYDPAVFGGGSVNAANSWGATTLALRPAPAAQTLTPGLLTNTPAFYTPTVTPGTATLSPSLVAGSEVFYAASVTPGSVTLTPSLLTNTPTFHAPTVAPVGSPQTLTQDTRSDFSPTFYGPTVSSALTLTQTARLDNSPSFFGPSLSVGPVTLAPSLLTNSPSFFSPTVTRGIVTLSQGTRFDNTQVFYGPTVSRGPVSLTPLRLDNAQSFFSPTVSLEGSPQTLTQATRLENTSDFFNLTVTRLLEDAFFPRGGGGGYPVRPAPLRPRKLFEDDPEDPVEVLPEAKLRPKPPLSLIKQAVAGSSVEVVFPQIQLPVGQAPSISRSSQLQLTPGVAALLDDD